MREILFRGKRTDNVEWVYGDLVQGVTRQKGMAFIWSENEAPIDVLEFVVDPATIGQYTGLKDKNGQRIFEGDIVKAVLPDTAAQRGFVWPEMPVVFTAGAFGLLDSHGTIPLRSFAPTVTFEVKGNIHDNPDLLKEVANG